MVEQLTYDFSGVASEIVIDRRNGTDLSFSSITLEPGWSYRLIRDTASQVTITFRRTSGEGEAKFEVVREGGRLLVKKER